MAMAPYVHSDLEKNLQAAEQILYHLLKHLEKPRTAVDFGCGLGAFLAALKKSEVEQIIGIDGEWVNHADLLIPKEVFLVKDLTSIIRLKDRFDWTVCLEVAEHLPESYADTLVENLVYHSDIIIFSAATPLQGGQNHINEQPFSYWFNKFESRGYVILDIFRKEAWNNDKIPWWYKQNLFVITKSPDLILKFEAQRVTSQVYQHYIHPQNYVDKINRMNYLENELKYFKKGEASIYYYFQLLLRKVRNVFYR